MEIPEADAFTTGQIAKMCNVSANTVKKWIDDRLLDGYRLPGSLDRRVRRATLINFLISRGLARPGEVSKSPTTSLVWESCNKTAQWSKQE